MNYLWADPWQKGSRKRALRMIACTHLASSALKGLVQRPELEVLPPLARIPTRISFPSTHAADASAGTVICGRLVVPKMPLAALASGLAYSRLHLGVHHPSNVIAGTVG